MFRREVVKRVRSVVRDIDWIAWLAPAGTMGVGLFISSQVIPIADSRE
jgi:hypothetical protein